MSEINLPRSLVETYLSRRVEDARTLQSSLQADSVEKFNLIGHQLMGNARSYGFPNLEVIAARMEKLSHAELKRAGPQLLSEFTQWLSRAKSSES